MAQCWKVYVKSKKMQNTNKMKTFIVDDDPFSRELYQQHLTNKGFNNISCFDNGQECINQLIEQPAIIFLDYNMSSLNGLDVLKKIKRFDPDIIIVLVSAQEDMQVAVNALKYGAFDYIIKGENDLQSIDAVINKIDNLFVVLQSEKNKGSFCQKLFSLFKFKK